MKFVPSLNNETSSLKNPNDFDMKPKVTRIRQKIKGRASSYGCTAVGFIPHKFFTLITLHHYNPVLIFLPCLLGILLTAHTFIQISLYT